MATGRKSDFTLPTFDDIFSTQEQRDEAKLAKIRDIPISEIDDFPDHPFQVRDDEDIVHFVLYGLEKKPCCFGVFIIIKSSSVKVGNFLIEFPFGKSDFTDVL